METELKKERLSIPVAIIIAGVIIAGAVIWSSKSNANLAQKQQPQAIAQQGGNLDAMNPISKDDHIRGNPDATVKIVEYSDMECPFCKSFHLIMKQIMDEYGKTGKVAWVYRHFPLDSIHSKARPEAVASECVAEQGGNDAFWKFTDRFFELTPSNNRTDIETVIPQIVREIGLNEEQFVSCRTSGRYDKHIQDDLDNATATGGNGTPWSIVVGKNGKKYPLSGAQPYSSIKQLIDLALQGK